MDKVLQIEDPDRVGIVDFIGRGCSVRCSIKDDKLYISVSATKGNCDSSEFACADYEFDLPEYDDGYDPGADDGEDSE